MASVSVQQDLIQVITDGLILGAVCSHLPEFDVVHWLRFIVMTNTHRPVGKCRAAVLSLTGCLAVLGLALSSCSPTTDVSSSGSPELAADAPYETRLANHLTAQEATMYGAFWCPHCQDQKALFGDAADQVPYVECDAEGENAQPELCQTKAIQGYPTWEINGELYPGTRSLEELAQLSGFEAPSGD